MGMYTPSTDVREKEKIFGGIFTVSQFVVLSIGVIVGMLMGLMLATFFGHIMAALIGFVIGFSPFVYLAMKKVRKLGDMEYMRYLYLNFLYKKKTKKYPNININYEDEGE